MLVGRWRRRVALLPISLVVCARHQVDPDGGLWWSVLEATGQPLGSGAAAAHGVAAVGGQ